MSRTRMWLGREIGWPTSPREGTPGRQEPPKFTRQTEALPYSNEHA